MQLENLQKSLKFVCFFFLFLSQDKLQETMNRRIQLAISRPTENTLKIKDCLLFPFQIGACSKNIRCPATINWKSHPQWDYRWTNDSAVYGPFPPYAMQQCHEQGCFAAGIVVRPSGSDEEDFVPIMVLTGMPREVHSVL